MQIKSEKTKGFLYLTLIALAIVCSAIYGNMMDGNIGSFPQYIYFGGTFPLWLIILVPSLITILYIFIIIIAYKNGIIKKNVNHFAFIVVLLIMFIYMALVIFMRDIKHIYGTWFDGSRDIPTLNEKIWALMSFYLSLTNIYAFFSLIKPVKGFKGFIIFAFTVLILYELSVIGYSLVHEWDKYINFEGLVDVFYKHEEGSVWIVSFFGIGNVFGHNMFVAVLVCIASAYLFRKYWLIIPSFFFAFFVFYSACRATILATFMLYVGLFVYLYIRSWHHSKALFTFFTLVLIALTILITIDFNLYNFIRIEIGDTSLSLKEFVFSIFENYINTRLYIITDLFPAITKGDRLFGFGYGVSYIIPRTYDYYIYYIHNSFYEIYLQGGILYSLFIASLWIYVFVRTIKCGIKTQNRRLLGIISFMSFSQCFYGMFESLPLFFNNFVSVMFTLLTVTLPNLWAEYEKGGYINMLINDIQYDSSIKSLIISDIYNVETLKKKLKLDVNYEELQALLLRVLNPLNYGDTTKLNVIYNTKSTDLRQVNVNIKYEYGDEVVVYISDN